MPFENHQFFKKIILLTIFLLNLSITVVHAETRYVSDFLIINLKTQINSPYSTVARISTGDALEILDEQEKYYKVKTATGKIGWVQTKYTTDKLPKKVIIQQLEKKIAELKRERKNGVVKFIQDNKNLSTQLQLAEKTIRDQESKIQKLTEVNKILHNIDPKKYQAMTILAKDLKKQTSQLQQQIQILKKDNDRLRDNSRIFWFATGAVIFLTGILFGKMPAKRQRKTLNF